MGDGAGIFTWQNAEMVKNVENKNGQNTFFITNFLINYKVNQNKSLLFDKVSDFACIAFAYLLFLCSLRGQTDRQHSLY